MTVKPWLLATPSPIVVWANQHRGADRMAFGPIDCHPVTRWNEHE